MYLACSLFIYLTFLTAWPQNVGFSEKKETEILFKTDFKMATKQFTLLDVQVKWKRYFYEAGNCIFLKINYYTRKEALSYEYSKQPIIGLTQKRFRELSFSRLECGVHDRLHISSADWWDRLLTLA